MIPPGSPNPAPSSYLRDAARSLGVSQNNATAMALIRVYREALLQMNQAIEIAYLQNRLAETFVNQDLRPELGQIIDGLRALKPNRTVTLVNREATLDTAVRHILQAVGYFNAAAQIENTIVTTGEVKHWPKYYACYLDGNEHLGAAQELLETP